MFTSPTNDWRPFFEQQSELLAAIYHKYEADIQKGYQVYPPQNQIFRAFELTPVKKLRVVLLGQDPYHGKGQANGLCFSVNPGQITPPSLRNIFTELGYDSKNCLFKKSRSTDLSDWANQGVLMLNSVLTVRENSPNSHQKIGWEQLTDLMIQYVAAQKPDAVFILLGSYAIRKKNLIPRHLNILTAPHPSPLSAYRGFFGSKVFERCNQMLKEPIKW